MQSAFTRQAQKGSVEKAEAAIVRENVKNQPPEEEQRHCPGLACCVHGLQVQLRAGNSRHVSG